LERPPFRRKVRRTCSPQLQGRSRLVLRQQDVRAACQRDPGPAAEYVTIVTQVAQMHDTASVPLGQLLPPALGPGQATLSAQSEYSRFTRKSPLGSLVTFKLRNRKAVERPMIAEESVRIVPRNAGPVSDDQRANGPGHSSRTDVHSRPAQEVDTYWTSLSDSAAVIIEQYHQHGTSEQHRFELKSDTDLGRLTSGEFNTSQLLFHFTMVAYNVLRMIGQITNDTGSFSFHKRAFRRRIKP